MLLLGTAVESAERHVAAMGERTPRVLHLSTFDRQGGAALAAFRLHVALRGLGVRSRMKVQVKLGDDPTVDGSDGRAARLKDALIATMDRAPLALHRARARTSFDLQWIGSGSASSVARMGADLIHLHWVAGGFLGIGALGGLGAPLVWTLHDMWPFTGGCHVSGDCDRYRDRCGRCWQLGSATSRDLTRWTWRRKRRSWRAIEPSLVAPSAWMAACARSSSLFRDRPVTVIPNGVDTSVFKPLERTWARTCLGMDPERRVILFGGSDPVGDPNKGFPTLVEALHLTLRELDATRHELVVLGCGEPAEPPDSGLPTRYLGRLSDEVSMAVAYAAADVLVVPSRQESFCQTAAEALACGIPVVAFDATGLRDVVSHRETGYLATPFEPADLAAGLLWVLGSEERRRRLAGEARQKAVATFDVERVARRHLDLYARVLDRDRGAAPAAT